MRKLPNLDAKFPSLPRVESRFISRIPTICGLVGSTGSGKSYLAVSIIEMLRREGSITRVFVISPTAVSNQILNAICTDPERDKKYVLDSKVFDRLREIEDLCDADAAIYRDQLEYLVTKKKFCDGDEMTDAETMLMERYGYRDVKAVRPSPALFLDDCQSSPIFSNSSKNSFTNLVLKSRHIGQGTGLSIFLAAQTSRGIPRGLRLNFTHLFLWRTQSLREKKLLYEEVGALMNEEEFDRKLDLYTALPYSYMFIDLWLKRISDSF